METSSTHTSGFNLAILLSAPPGNWKADWRKASLSPYARKRTILLTMNKKLLALLALGTLCSCKREAVEATAETAAELQTVTVRPTTRDTLTKTLTLTAEFIPYQEVDVMAKISGYVQKINVDVGDRVQQGQLLATLESPEMRDDLTRAGASTQRFKADVQRARDEVKRAESVYAMTHLTSTRLASVMTSQPGLVAQQEVDDAQAKDLSAQAQLAGARSAMNSAE